MATHSSVLAWRIPGTGEPGGLPSMGLHRVGHDWSDLEAGTLWSEYFIEHFQPRIQKEDADGVGKWDEGRIWSTNWKGLPCKEFQNRTCVCVCVCVCVLGDGECRLRQSNVSEPKLGEKSSYRGWALWGLWRQFLCITQFSVGPVSSWAGARGIPVQWLEHWAPKLPLA